MVPHLTYISHLLLWRRSDSLTSWKFIWSRKKLSLVCDVGNAHPSELNSPSPWWAAPQLQMLNSVCRKNSAPGDPNPSKWPQSSQGSHTEEVHESSNISGKMLWSAPKSLQELGTAVAGPLSPGWDEVKGHRGTAKDILTDRGAGPYSIWATPWAAHKYLLKWFSVWEQVEGQAGKQLNLRKNGKKNVLRKRTLPNPWLKCALGFLSGKTQKYCLGNSLS